jgi:hypothetical protein
MKKLILFLLLPLVIFAQEEPLHTGELTINLINYGSSWSVTFVATAVTERWDEDYYLTDDYENASVITSSTNGKIQAFFDLIIDQDAGVNPIVALGKYKISAIEGGTEQAYFYMDWRSSDDEFTSADVYFKYDVSNNHFKNHENTQIIDGTSQTWWGLREDVQQITTGLELYLNYSNQSGNPYLSWNDYHDSNILGYNINRKITTSSGSQTDVIFTTSTSYLDDEFEIDPRNGDDQVEYWIKAKISSSQVSLEGNHIQLTGDSYIQWKNSDQGINKDLSYILDQNYPNPFNPSTIISYQLIKDGFVNLQIYNSIGETVTELVNQQQEQGNYSIEFNAVNLPSGIYYYKIKTDKFTDVKKMILLK